jgi:hypothetical protein
MNSNTKKGLELIFNAKDINGYHIGLETDLHIDYISNKAEEDDIVIMGNNCTIFFEDFEDCVINEGSIKIKDQYIIHIK